MDCLDEINSTYPMKEPACHHPLDQLTAKEITRVANIVQQSNPDMNIIFNTITLKEPSKELMLSFLGWNTKESRVNHIEREAITIVLEKPSMKCYKGVVSLDFDLLKTFKCVPDVQPLLTTDDMFEIEKIVIADKGVIAECRELGVHDMSMIIADPWAIARHSAYKDRTNRLAQALMYMRTCENDNQYAHPLDFVPIIDIGLMKVINIERIKPRDSQFNRPKIPLQNHNYLPEFIGEENFCKDLKPISIQQPEGVSFKVDGTVIDWQNWNMKISMNYREGLVIHNVSYLDGEKKRPLFYRISLSEMVVPYSDPSNPYNRKHAFDVGEYGLGLCTNTLNLGCDCLGSIYYFDAVFNDHKGNPLIVPNAVCLHEEDNGILLKHTEYRTNASYTIRSRRLVISQIVTVANYDYGLYYYFYQDGSFQYEVKATGELNTHVLAEDETPGGYGVIVAPQINAQSHQHLFTMRIDPMIDGINNSVCQVETSGVPYPTGHPNNIYGNGFQTKTEILKDTIEAQKSYNLNTSRFWKIINENYIHPYSETPVGWKIYSHHQVILLALDDSVVAQRAGFSKKTLWVTPYDEDQMFAGGFYCNQSDGNDGVEKWAKEGQSIRNRDIVVWFTFGITHIPRVEDFPIMPVEKCGFYMKPSNFFIRNPSIDVPPASIRLNCSKIANKKQKRKI
ncbi:copper amine oxidase [Spinellus fusiger]|nr:copper amine oxidase [Spinellus fusiger]